MNETSETEAKPDKAKLIPVFILAVILSAVALVFGGKMCAANHERELLATGAPATAEIVRVTDTGNRYNRNPEMILTVVVQPEGGEAYQADIERVLEADELQAYVVGAVLDVRYDPQDPHDLAIVGLASTQAASPAPSAGAPATTP